MRVALEDVVPFEAVDLRAAQPRVEGDRVGDDGPPARARRAAPPPRAPGRRAGAASRRSAAARPVAAGCGGRDDATAPTPRRRCPTRPRCASRWSSGTRPLRASWSIQRCQSISVISSAIRGPNSGQHVVLQRAAHASDRRVRRTPCPCRGAGRCGRARRRRATARPRSSNSRAARRELREVLAALASCAASHDSDLAAALARAADHTGLPVDRSPTRGRARTACSGTARRRRRTPGTTSSGRRRCPGNRVLRQFAMTYLAATRGNSVPRGTARGTEGVRNGGVRWGSVGVGRREQRSRRKPC